MSRQRIYASAAERQAAYMLRVRSSTSAGSLERAQSADIEQRLARCNAAYRTLAAENAALRSQVGTLEAELDSWRAEGQAVRQRSGEAAGVQGAVEEEGADARDDIPDDWGEDSQAGPDEDDVSQVRRPPTRRR